MDWCVAANEPIYELSFLGLGTSCLGGLVGCCPLVEITFCVGGWLSDVLLVAPWQTSPCMVSPFTGLGAHVGFGPFTFWCWKVDDTAFLINAITHGHKH